MYLKALEIKGFKSFFNKTHIDFPKGMISIVGPNGSGKSNILDAVRWVLGEQSIKALRGDNLEDVIFSGSQNKSAVGVCEVSIIIDNEDGKLNTEFSEVAIKRKAYRNGESKFYINDKACRLKDIKELLLDTGIGKEGYSIISQGKIDEIVGSASAQKRTLLEEASGITKYRYKKEEGEKNLEVASENLERIQDIYKEIELRVKPLYAQKQKAEKYLSLTKQLKKCELNKFMKTVDDINSKKQALLKEKSQCEQKLDQYQNEIAACTNEINIIKEELQKTQTQKEIQNDLLSKQMSDIKNKESEVAVKSETVKNLRASNEMLKEQIDSLSQKIAEKTAYIKDTTRKSQTDRQNLQNLQKEVQDLEQSKSDIECELSEMKKYAKKLEFEKSDMQSDLSRLEARMQLQQSNIASFKDKLAEYEQRQAQIDGEISAVSSNIDKDSEDLRKNKENLQEITDTIMRLQDDLSNMDNSIAQNTQKQNDLSVEQRKLSSEIEVLKRLDESMQGFSKGVKAVLSNKNLSGICDIVANVIQVKPGYEKAIEQLISGRMDNIIISKATDASGAINHLKKNSLGRATFLPMDTIKPAYMNYNDLGVKAIDVVTYDEKYKNIVQNILGRMVIVDDMTQGLIISKKYSHSFKVATKGGEIFNVGGSITGGSSGYTKDVFQRRAHIASNMESIKKLQNQIKALTDEKNSLISEKEKVSEKIKVQVENQKSVQNIIVKLSENILKLNAELSLANSKKENLSQEQAGLVGTDAKARESLASDESSIAEFLDKISQKDNFIRENEEKIRLIELKSEKNMSELSAKKIDISSLSQSQAYTDSSIKSAQKEIELSNGEKEKSTQKYSQNEKTVSNSENEIARLTDEINSGKLKADEIRDELSNLDKELLSKRQNSSQKEAEFEKIRQKSAEISAEITNRTAELDKLSYKLSLTEENIKQSYDMQLQDIYEYKDENLKFTESDIRNLKNEISSLGNVNPDSIEEYEKVNERYLFYKTQKEDLEQSISKLKQIIRHLEQDMTNDFKTNFDIINKNFGKIFSLLFGGGSAKLILTDENDVLDSDIEICVNPPGKKLKSLSMLSGGEKALSAIALLFAIISQKAVPFCILDEIDAPLDDANIYRFLDYLATLKDTTQFITITHRRNTMEASDYIYAVFMQEKGISEVVSLSLAEVSDYASD